MSNLVFLFFFLRYYPTANSYASVMGGMLSDALGCVGFSWMSSPSCTELEMVTMDWLAKSMDLPKVFLHSCDGNGGGVIQGSCSESTLIALLAAKHRKIEKIGKHSEEDIESKLVAYTSRQAHSSVEKGIRIVRAKMRILETDSNFRLRGDTLRKAVDEDKAKGLIPFFIGGSFGTTSVCSFDDVDELGDIAQVEDMWMHVDGAYAGSALICPEYRCLMKGLEKTDSFVVNCHKWLMVNFDCSAFYVRDSMDLVKLFEINPTYLKHAYQNEIPDFRHWQIPLGRRFRSLKLWMVMKSYGVSGLQENIRRQIRQAKIFESLLRDDDRFEVVNEVLMGLVCFQLKGGDTLNRELNKRVNDEKRIHMTPAEIDGKLVLRFVVASRLTEDEDIEFAWNEIKRHTDLLLNDDVDDLFVMEEAIN